MNTEQNIWLRKYTEEVEHLKQVKEQYNLEELRISVNEELLAGDSITETEYRKQLPLSYMKYGQVYRIVKIERDELEDMASFRAFKITMKLINNQMMTEREEIMMALYYANDGYVFLPTEEARICEDCGELIPSDEGQWVSNGYRFICRGCLEDGYSFCQRCEEWYDSDCVNEVYNDDGTFYADLCESCIDNDDQIEYNEDEENYERCQDCSRERLSIITKHYLSSDSILRNNYTCQDCMISTTGRCPRHTKQWKEEQTKEELNCWIYDDGRRGYHESSHNRFKGLIYRMPHEHPFLYYGIELELLFDAPMSLREKITKEFIDATEGLFVAEYDRSVDNLGCGTEFISRPTSYKRWMDKETIRRLEAGFKAIEKWLPKEQPNGCGLHVHMSKKFFEENTKKHVPEIKSDIDWLFQIYQEEFEKISRRAYTMYCSSKVDKAIEMIANSQCISPEDITITIKKGSLPISIGHGDTHHMCLTETPNTIETRTFRSTTKVEEILATIEFCRAIAHFARNTEATEEMTLGDILATKDSVYLDDYLRKNKVDKSKKFKSSLTKEGQRNGNF